MITGTQCVFGQIVGSVRDKETNRGCSDARVYLLKGDSSIIQQAQCRDSGKFYIRGPLEPGGYILLVLCPGQSSLYQMVVVTNSIPIDVGVMLLVPKSDSLQAVIVRPSALRPRLKGDTVEFNTANITLRAHTAVEEMIGLIPGLQVDVQGNITYNGEKISNLLVDGEDIFGADPKIVTRNFDASRIDKVQIIDRRSDQATFTGIDDGTRTKTLNLVMKQDSKNGYFGKIDGGGDVQGVFSGSGLVADLQGRQQTAGLGFISNTGSTGFSMDLGGSSYAGIFELNGNDDALGASAGTGVPFFTGAGLHYGNTWDGSINHFVGNFQYSYLSSQPRTFSYSQQAIPDSNYVQFQHSHSLNRQNQSWSFGIYNYVPDSLNSIRVVYHFSSSLAQNVYYDYTNSNFNQINVNGEFRDINDNVHRQNVGASVSYRIRARHNTGRVFTITAGLGNVRSALNGYLYSVDSFFQPNGLLESLDTTDQRKQIVNRSLNLNATITYTQPLFKKVSLGISYGLNYTGSNALQGTFGKVEGKYNLYVDSLSSNFQERNLDQHGSLNLQGGDTRLSYSIGMGVIGSSYRQHNLQADSVIYFQYLNITPHILITSNPDRTTRLLFEYGASTQQPSIAQLQPVINNSNPLQITLGNPGLRPDFNQYWRLKLSRVKNWIYSLNFNFGLNGNSISTKATTDSLGRQISQPLNVNGDKSASGVLYLNKRVLGLNLGMNAGQTFTRELSYVNSYLNRTDGYGETAGFSLGYYAANKYSFQLSTQFSYFASRSSANTASYLHYWAESHSANLNLFFIGGFEIHTSAVYNWQQGFGAFSSSTVTLLLNASIRHNFLHDRAALEFQLNNLLDENAGITRTNAINVNTESSTNILGRYWLLSVAYHFDHKLKKR
jgi:hypothetical protein